ncbi:esterase/lipase [Rivularia sp. PCC 7116]|uniref:alpha/beta hydrolase n=1 Tax=Rivularia sp. PCC 7116 TaxID=373994 RepID=UPI00029F23DF|nr:alpha/beta hydrolase [Rivularia sp. PCC 7116]AFY53387.1 esterase/lipase [Rivularia sp. PCC 7116]
MLKKLSSKPFLIIAIFSLLAAVIIYWQYEGDRTIAEVGSKANYQLSRNLVYHKVNDSQLKLDLYQNKNPGLHPTLIVIHGGGWINQSKEGLKPFFEPYLNWGFSVVNINYRLASTALAPAAVQDARCALHWVVNNAEKYNFDKSKIITSGFSAGGHLSLTTGMIPPQAGFDNQCPSNKKNKLAAIVNWSGITDVEDLIKGKNEKYYAVEWLGNQINDSKIELAKNVSPINYVRADLPPILTIHGDKDTFVPYTHAVRLHQKLDLAGVSNQLYSLKEVAHGGFNKKQKQQIYATIKEFLIKHQLFPSR